MKGMWWGLFLEITVQRLNLHSFDWLLHVLINLFWLIACSFSQFIPIVQTQSDKKPAVNGSYIAQINPADKGCLLEKYSSKYTDCEFGLLANLYASEGQPGKVRTWSKGDFACRALWLKGNPHFSVLKFSMIRVKKQFSERNIQMEETAVGEQGEKMVETEKCLNFWGISNSLVKLFPYKSSIQIQSKHAVT